MSALPRPRLLFIAPVMPDCSGNGLAMRQGQFLAAYAKDFDIDLAVMPLAGAANADANFAWRHVRRLSVFPLDGVDTHFSLIMRLQDPQARIPAFRAYGRPSITARLTQPMHATFQSWIAAQHYNLVHTGRLYLLSLAMLTDAPRIVDADEDDALLFRQIAAGARRRGKAVAASWADAEANNAANCMAKLLPGMNHVFAASESDATSLCDYGPPVSVIPNVAARPPFPARPRGARVLFVGTLGYEPNAEAITWFIQKCWPRLRKRLPHLRLDIVGGGAPPALRRLAMQPGIVWHGRQKSLQCFYARASAVVVPIRSGGGSRIKLLEAAAYGRPIVATTAGAEGTALTPQRDFLHADDPFRFTRAVAAVLTRGQKFGRAARKTVEQHHHPAGWQRRILAVAGAIASPVTA
jgi:glycosyltransferase involved in cell wall biosynthesis